MEKIKNHKLCISRQRPLYGNHHGNSDQHCTVSKYNKSEMQELSMHLRMETNDCTQCYWVHVAASQEKLTGRVTKATHSSHGLLSQLSDWLQHHHFCHLLPGNICLNTEVMLQKWGLLQKTPSFSTTCITKMGTMPIQNSFNESKFSFVANYEKRSAPWPFFQRCCYWSQLRLISFT